MVLTLIMGFILGAFWSAIYVITKVTKTSKDNPKEFGLMVICTSSLTIFFALVLLRII
jgi:uncharacterized membrane protein